MQQNHKIYKLFHKTQKLFFFVAGKGMGLDLGMWIWDWGMWIWDWLGWKRIFRRFEA